MLRYRLSEHKVGVEIRKDKFAISQEENDGTRRNAGYIMLLETRMRLNTKYRFDRCSARPAC